MTNTNYAKQGGLWSKTSTRTYRNIFIYLFTLKFPLTVCKNWGLNPIQDFSELLTDGGRGGGWSRVCKKVPLPKICHTYPIMMKLDTVIPYLKKIQKIYESCDTLIKHPSAFFHRNQQILLYQETDIDCVLIHNF